MQISWLTKPNPLNHAIIRLFFSLVLCFQPQLFKVLKFENKGRRNLNDSEHFSDIGRKCEKQQILVLCRKNTVLPVLLITQQRFDGKCWRTMGKRVTYFFNYKDIIVFIFTKSKIKFNSLRRL